MAEKKITNDLDTDYRLLGIASALKEYKVCHHLNQLLGCDFRKLPALVFEPKDRIRKTEFSVFKAEDAEKNTFVVFTNKNMGEYPQKNKKQRTFELRRRKRSAKTTNPKKN